MTGPELDPGTSAADAPPRLVCISTDADAAVVLQHVVQTILPSAKVDSADTSILRDAPEADCVILSVGTMYSAAMALTRELRARGFQHALLVVADSPPALAIDDLQLLGVGAAIATTELASQLPAALASQLAVHRAGGRSVAAQSMLRSARRLQSLIAAGQLASGLQHKLNNPLAALLAEAQLMELEPMAPEHTNSIRRIVELCRRVIDVTKTFDGMGTTGGFDT